jgi:hypothetical protein
MSGDIVNWELTRLNPGLQPPKRPNHFADVQNVTELIYRTVGAGSTCWVGPGGTGEFDTTQAIQVADDAIERLIELGWA